VSEGSAGRKGWRLAFWLVLLFAVVVRVPGIFGQGYPECFYPDEVNAIQRALRFGAEKTADPGWFNKPALAYYVWFGAYGAYYAGGRATGLFAGPEEFGIWAFNRIGPFLAIGRLVSTLFGIGTVWLTYLLGKRLAGRALGIVAALALALTFAHVATGQWVKEDVPAGFFHTGATVLLVSSLVRARPKDSACSGLLGGLGMATKYYSVGLLIPAAFVHLFPAPSPRAWSRRVALLIVFAVAFLAGFFIGSPYNFLRPDFFDQQVWPAALRALALIGLRFGAVGVPQAPRSVFVDSSGDFSVVDVCWALVESLYLPEGVGLAFFVLAVVGLVLALARRTRLDVFMIVATLGQAVFLAVTNRLFSEPRHLIVLYPLLAIWIGQAALFLAGLLRRAAPRLAPAGVGCAVVLAAACVPSLVLQREPDGAARWVPGRSPVRMLVDRSLEPVRGHTGLAALRWFEVNVPKDAAVINDHEVLPLRPNATRCEWASEQLKKKPGRGANVWPHLRRWEYRKKAASSETSRPVYDVLVIDAPWQAEDLDALEEHRRTYDTTWPHDVESRPSDVAPVARYTDVPAGEHASLASRPGPGAALPAAWPAARWLIGGRPVEWLVSSEVSYNNYADDTPAHRKKRASFPGRAAFYDDLKAHYDCRQWSPSPGGMTGPVIRVYDLRRRVSAGSAVVEMGAFPR
jgi:4-amino-4-deoxy-L-arabinose transferase-like glycosyltransferase